MVESSPAPGLREGDHPVTLISHTSPNLALSITALPLLVPLSSAFALLIASVGIAPFSPPDGFPAKGLQYRCPRSQLTQMLKEARQAGSFSFVPRRGDCQF